MTYVNLLNIALNNNMQGDVIFDEINHDKIDLITDHFHSSTKKFKALQGNYLLHTYLEDDQIFG